MEELRQHQRKAKELKQMAEDSECSEIQARGTRMCRPATCRVYLILV